MKFKMSSVLLFVMVISGTPIRTVYAQGVDLGALGQQIGGLPGVSALWDIVSVYEACNSLDRVRDRAQDLLSFAENPYGYIREYQEISAMDPRDRPRDRWDIPFIAGRNWRNAACFKAELAVVGVDWDFILDLHGVGREWAGRRCFGHC